MREAAALRHAVRSVVLALATLALVGGMVAATVAPGSPLSLAGSRRGPAASAAAPIAGQTHTSGYLPTRDGTLLAYDLILPGDGLGKWPTLFTYDGYDAGSNVDAKYAAQFAPEGYAIVGVNVRGTGCSGGTFDFFEPVEGLDGYDAIEWMAKQPWSNGKVAMIGKSFPGITQLFVAATQPPHLVAAAPGHVYGDIYRDVAYPGGIFNYAFAGLWAFVAQPEPGAATALQKKQNDPVCMQNVAQHTVTDLPFNAFVQAQEHRFDDGFIQSRSPTYLAQNITVPLYLFQSWQDEQVGVRGVNVVEHLPATTPWFLTLSNGDHGMYRTATSLERLDRFFAHYLKDEANGFESEPRVTVWWDAGAEGSRAPAWTRTYDAWPVTAGVEPLTLYPRAGGVLSQSPPTTDEAPDAYVYPAGSSSNGAGYGETCPASQLCNPQWPVANQTRAPGPVRATFTTGPLADDVVVLGPANFTFWLSSTAVDTDVQVTVSEVRPDGRIVLVQHGWLRASHRQLDGARSSLYRPFQSHTREDLLTPGAPVQLNVEVFPAGHAFRSGSRIRVDVEAPSNVPELWGFADLPLPAIDRVLHDAQHPASLTLPTLAGEHPDAPLPPCGSLVRQSCVSLPR